MSQPVREVDAAQTAAWLKAGEAVLVDVREAHEFAAERIPGALLSPLSTFDPAVLAGLDGKRVVVSCAAGARSLRAAAALAPVLGRSDVVSLAGGIGAWKSAGLPVVAG